MDYSDKQTDRHYQNRQRLLRIIIIIKYIQLSYSRNVTVLRNINFIK